MRPFRHRDALHETVGLSPEQEGLLSETKPPFWAHRFWQGVLAKPTITVLVTETFENHISTFLYGEGNLVLIYLDI